MSKSRTKQTIIVHHHPQVIAMANAAVERLEKLLTICDYQIDAFQVKNSTSKESSQRELLGLARMVLNIQKELNKYASIAYPANKEFLPLPTIEASLESNASKPGSYIEVERDSINDTIETSPTTTNGIKSSAAHNSTRSHYASKPKHSISSYAAIASPSYEVTLQEEQALLSGKKSTKNQKFSHSFFQNRNQKTN